MARIGLLGGTFDPIHNGHLQLARIAKEMCSLDQVVFIPAYHPPHKQKEQLTPFSHRVEMLKLALGEEAGYTISSLEKHLSPPTYTVDMLRAFHQNLNKGDETFFIIGIDAFLEIQSWKAYRAVLDATHFIVFPREGFTDEELHLLLLSFGYSRKANFWESSASRFQIYYLECHTIDVSSSAIRKNLAGGGFIKGFLEEPVKKYIQLHKLYAPLKKS